MEIKYLYVEVQQKPTKLIVKSVHILRRLVRQKGKITITIFFNTLTISVILLLCKNIM